MHRLLITASAILAGLLLAGCGGAGQSGGSPAPGGQQACANSGAAHRAYLMVTHLDGKTIQRCIGFTAAQINGENLIRDSGIQHQTQTFSFGKAVCQVDNEPKQFTECLPKNAPYWGLYVYTKGGGWQQASTGYTQVELSDGGALGLRYTPATAASPSPPPAPKA